MELYFEKSIIETNNFINERIILSIKIELLNNKDEYKKRIFTILFDKMKFKIENENVFHKTCFISHFFKFSYPHSFTVDIVVKV
jgi:hypothetical protein